MSITSSKAGVIGDGLGLRCGIREEVEALVEELLGDTMSRDEVEEALDGALTRTGMNMLPFAELGDSGDVSP